MSAPMRLTSADNPRVKAVVRLLRQQRQRRQSGLFVAEGRRQVQRALAAGLAPRELYLCPALGPAGPLDAGDCPVFEVGQALMRKMAYRQNPEAVLAVFAQPRRGLGDLAPPPGALWLVAVGLEKPGNLGAMARSAEAAGAAGLLLAEGVVDPFNPNAIHASTGAVFVLPVVGGTTPDVLAFLERRQARLFAAVPGAGRAHTRADLTGEAAVVIGAEDVGLDDRWRSAARTRGACIGIPMRGRVVDSLNASNAAAILLFEALRQRGEAAAGPPGRTA